MNIFVTNQALSSAVTSGKDAGDAAHLLIAADLLENGVPYKLDPLVTEGLLCEGCPCPQLIAAVSLLGDSTVDLRDLQAGERVVLSSISLLGDENRREPRKKDRKRFGIPENTKHRARADRREVMSVDPPPELELRGFKFLGDVTLIEV